MATFNSLRVSRKSKLRASGSSEARLRALVYYLFAFSAFVLRSAISVDHQCIGFLLVFVAGRRGMQASQAADKYSVSNSDAHSAETSSAKWGRVFV